LFGESSATGLEARTAKEVVDNQQSVSFDDVDPNLDPRLFAASTGPDSPKDSEPLTTSDTVAGNTAEITTSIPILLSSRVASGRTSPKKRKETVFSAEGLAGITAGLNKSNELLSEAIEAQKSQIGKAVTQFMKEYSKEQPSEWLQKGLKVLKHTENAEVFNCLEDTQRYIFISAEIEGL